MKIGFIGAGKVGCSFAKYLQINNVQISGFFSRNAQNAKFASEFTESDCFGDFYSLIANSDIVFITVKDSVISDVWKKIYSLDLQGKIICHCSGSLSSEVFQNATEKGCFVCSVHPMIAINNKDKAFENFAKAFFTVEGNSSACDEIQKILKGIGNNVKVIGQPQKKTLYHLACVFQSNLVTTLIAQGTEFLIQCGFDEKEAVSATMPLILGNIQNIYQNGILGALTGPVERCDLLTIEKHINALGDDLKNKEIYKLLSSKLSDFAKIKNPDTCYEKLDEILEVSK